MSKAKLAPVPEPEPEAEEPKPSRPAEVTVEVAGGTVRMSTAMTGEDFLTLYQLMDLDLEDEGAILNMYGPIMAMLKRNCLSHTLDTKPLLRRPMPVLLQVWRGWNKAMQESAVDPTSASD